MNKRPAFLLYTGDWLKDPGIASLDYNQKGVFVTLLCFAHQEAGELRYCDGGEPFTTSDLSRMLGIAEDKTQQLIDTFIRCRCLKRREDDGCLYNEGLVKQEKEAQVYHDNRKRASEAGVEARRRNKQPMVVPNVEPNVVPMVEPNVVPNDNQRLNQKATLSSSSSITSSIDNNLLKEKNKKEKMNLSPGTMPTTEQEAVDFCAGIGVPESFIREKAYPQAVVNGFKTGGGNPIAHWPQYVRTYYLNWNNKNQNNQKAVRKPQYESDVIHLKSLNNEAEK